MSPFIKSISVAICAIGRNPFPFGRESLATDMFSLKALIRLVMFSFVIAKILYHRVLEGVNGVWEIGGGHGKVKH